jgi:hypothetical protein
MRKQRFSKETRKLAFKLWRQNDGNASKVSRYEGMPSIPTIIKWAEEGDWQGKLDKAKELVKEAFADSDDPLLRKIVKDDAFLLIFVGQLRALASEALKKRRRKVMPKSTGDLIALLRFIGEVEAKVLPQSKPDQGNMDLSVRRAIKSLLPDTPEGREMAQTVVHDLRSRLRVIEGTANRHEEVS